MIKLETSNRGGLFGLISVLLAASAIQGCAMNTGFSNSTLQNRPDSVGAGSSETPLSATPPNISETPLSVTPPNMYVGAASWYGPGFNGKKTASGDIFDETKFTAAHKTLPLGSKAKITHLSNGKSVQVLINDRGPYVEGRMIGYREPRQKLLESSTTESPRFKLNCCQKLA